MNETTAAATARKSSPGRCRDGRAVRHTGRRIDPRIVDDASPLWRPGHTGNNAGGPANYYQGMKCTRFIDSTEEVWRMVVDINLIGTMIVTRAVLDGMIERQKGKIVNVGSVAGVNGLPNMVDYSAAKGGVIALTRALAIELGEYNINVNCVSPGSIDSRGGGPPTYLKRVGKPHEVANLIAFLASDESDFITGQNFVIDGGRVLSTKCV